MMKAAPLMCLIACIGSNHAKGDPNALWHIVHDQCVPHQDAFGVPLPCLDVDEAHGFVVLKDRVGSTQLLLLPTARITGIEDMAVLQSDTPNYFEFAWEHVGLIRALANSDLPDTDLSLALNSRFGRSQDQLHIHIDCIRPDVRTSLLVHQAAIGEGWAPFPVELLGHHYSARKVWTLNKPGADPIHLVSNSLEGARENMGEITIVAVGAEFGGEAGFILLADRADPATGDRGNGEELQDHACELARIHGTTKAPAPIMMPPPAQR